MAVHQYFEADTVVDMYNAYRRTNDVKISFICRATDVDSFMDCALTYHIAEVRDPAPLLGARRGHGEWVRVRDGMGHAVVRGEVRMCVCVMYYDRLEHILVQSCTVGALANCREIQRKCVPRSDVAHVGRWMEVKRRDRRNSSMFCRYVYV